LSQTNYSQNPRRLGDFEIVRELGRGGMGVVYEARQVSLNRKVALKVLSAGLGLTEKAVQRFRREAEAAAKLHHTNIVPVYATGEEEASHYYAMELIDGPSLDHAIRNMRQQSGPAASTPTASSGVVASPPELVQTGPYVASASISGVTAGLNSTLIASGSGYFDTVARRIAEVADALEYAHKQGVIHRDIKPSNLLLAPDGRLSVNDFGLARMLEQPGMTMTGEFVGTPAYMSPKHLARCLLSVQRQAQAAQRVHAGNEPEGEHAGTPAYMSPKSSTRWTPNASPPRDWAGCLARFHQEGRKRAS
jgi:serine/threonine protein kinase